MPLGEESDGALSVRDISVSFGGITALNGVSLDVHTGEVLGVIGPNGAGKTTLFNVICGFVTPAAGTLRWQGRALAQIRPHQPCPKRSSSKGKREISAPPVSVTSTSSSSFTPSRPPFSPI